MEHGACGNDLSGRRSGMVCSNTTVAQMLPQCPLRILLHGLPASDTAAYGLHLQRSAGTSPVHPASPMPSYIR